MEIKVVSYSEKFKQSLFSFTDACFSELGKKFEPEGRHTYYNDIENTFKEFLCMTIDNDQVIGTVALKKLDDNTAELKALYLDRGYRERGLGKLLIDAIIGEARTSGFKTIVLDSMKQYEEARKLYEKCGFTDCDRYNDNAYADVFMKLELEKEY